MSERNSVEFKEFEVTEMNGFLPKHLPLTSLPLEFAALNSLLEQMSIYPNSGQRATGDLNSMLGGLLSRAELGEASKQVPLYDLPSMIPSIIQKNGSYERDSLLLALFRDYTFWASAYCLEPCHLHKHGQHKQENHGFDEYGQARDVLPSNIAVPLVWLAEQLGTHPWLEYAQSYALANWKLVREKETNATQLVSPSITEHMTLENMKLIRTFEGSKDEAGFILVHVAMVRYTPALVKYVNEILASARNHDLSGMERDLGGVLNVMRSINSQMEAMWTNSTPASYESFRTFIMGVKDQPMFPKGLTYNMGSDKIPLVMYPRGESGANDSIIPVCDSLLQVTEQLPNNALTNILRDFRTYRPKMQTQYIKRVEEEARTLNVRKICRDKARPILHSLYCALLDQVGEFRERHWRFVKRYILAFTAHPVATGGSPIVQYLPNQLLTVWQMLLEEAQWAKDEPTIVKVSEWINTLKSEVKFLQEHLDKRTKGQ